MAPPLRIWECQIGAILSPLVVPGQTLIKFTRDFRDWQLDRIVMGFGGYRFNLGVTEPFLSLRFKSRDVNQRAVARK